MIAPDASSDWTYAPPVVVSVLASAAERAGVERQPGDATIELPPDARDISAEFAALDYSAPDSLRYAYKLDGYDRDWIDADSRHRVAAYTHLAPGDYTLKCAARTARRLEQSHPAPGRSRVTAWYETWWFAFIALLLILAAYGAHSCEPVLHRRQRELETVVTEARTSSRCQRALQELSLSDR